jgi:hypothetical protein
VATAQSHAVLTVTALMEPVTASLVFMVMTAAKVSAHCTSVFIHLAVSQSHLVLLFPIQLSHIHYFSQLFNLAMQERS